MSEHRAPPKHVIETAVFQGRRSPCRKSQRGVAIYDAVSGVVVAAGFNARADGVRCIDSPACRGACARNCEHAESAALRRLPRGEGQDPADCESSEATLEVVHIKVKNGEPVPSGGPSCWECSKAMLVRGDQIAAVWLFHEDQGRLWWRRYPISEFHRLTQLACKLPTGP